VQIFLTFANPKGALFSKKGSGMALRRHALRSPNGWSVGRGPRPRVEGATHGIGKDGPVTAITARSTRIGRTRTRIGLDKGTRIAGRGTCGLEKQTAAPSCPEAPSPTRAPKTGNRRLTEPLLRVNVRRQGPFSASTPGTELAAATSREPCGLVGQPQRRRPRAGFTRGITHLVSPSDAGRNLGPKALPMELARTGLSPQLRSEARRVGPEFSPRRRLAD
jgi:hypothetical protein